MPHHIHTFMYLGKRVLRGDRSGSGSFVGCFSAFVFNPVDSSCGPAALPRPGLRPLSHACVLCDTTEEVGSSL